MSVEACIRGKIAKGEISDAEGKKALKLFEEHREAVGDTGPAGDRLAAREIADRLGKDLEKTQRDLLLQLDSREAALKRMHKGAKDGNFVPGAKNRVEDVDFRHRSLRAELHGMLAEFTQNYRNKNRVSTIGSAVKEKFGGSPTKAVSRRRADLRNMVRELFGEATGDEAARVSASEFRKVAEYIRKRFNLAGGDIAERIDWRLPQTHDSFAVGSSTPEDWIAFIWDKLDRERMTDARGLPLTDKKLRSLLETTHERIRTHGYSEVNPADFTGKRAVSGKHSDPRFIVFKDSEGWLAYNEKFGKGDPFNAVVDYVDKMARDIALMETLGPNPDATVRYMKRYIETTGRKAGQRPSTKGIDNLYNVVSGKINHPDSGRWPIPGVNGSVADTMSSIRQWLSGVQLGGAALSAISDFPLQVFTRHYLDLPETKMIGQYLNLLDPRNIADQKLAVRMGLGAEGWTSTALSAHRFMSETNTPEFAAMFADGMLAASGLNAHTQAGRWSMGYQMMSSIGELIEAKTDWDSIPKGLRSLFDERGLDADMWNLIRKSELDVGKFDGHNIAFPSTQNIARQGTRQSIEAASRLHEAVLVAQEMAAPTSSARVKAMLLQSTQAGTFAGESLRSTAMYKSFPLMIFDLHARRYGREGRWGMVAGLIASTTVFGAFSVQLKQIARGKDPIDMTDPKFWGAAMVQGGSLGIYGDFLFQDQSRFGHSLADTFAGPVAGLVSDTYSVTVGNLNQALRGENANARREALKFLQRYGPTGSLWYTRLATDRLLFDNLQELADPNYRESFRRMEQQAQRDYGQKFFWRPGRNAPDRAPDLGKAVDR